MLGRYRALVLEAKQELKTNGFRSLLRRYGWKLVAIVFTGYLVRDLALYVALPWLVARHLIAE